MTIFSRFLQNPMNRSLLFGGIVLLIKEDGRRRYFKDVYSNDRNQANKLSHPLICLISWFFNTTNNFPLKKQTNNRHKLQDFTSQSQHLHSVNAKGLCITPRRQLRAGVTDRLQDG